MKYGIIAAAAALALAACGSETRNPLLETGSAGPAQAVAPQGPRTSIFTSQSPQETLDATPGWEVGTRFRTSKAGRVVGFRFYRAAGETGTNSARLWTNSGQKLAEATLPSGAGWQTVYLASSAWVRLTLNTNYRVSANTNTQQVKTPGGFYYGGAINNGPLTADGGYYGQPTGSMPASESSSMFFVDVIFEEDVPLPNLYVGAIQPTLRDFYGNEVLVIRICNGGPGASAATTTRYWHWRAPLAGGAGQWIIQTTLSTPALAATNSCYDHVLQESAAIGYRHEYHVTADINDVVYESNEGDNYATVAWNRQF